MLDTQVKSMLAAATPAHTLIGQYRDGSLSPVEIVRAALNRMQACEPYLAAMVTVLNEAALAQAEAAEEAWRRGVGGPLAGVPISIKDTFDIAGCVTTRGSRIHRRHIAFEDSGVVRRLRRAGAIFVGKTNTAEFGQSATSENRLGRVTRNPWDLERTPGGSSGGAAVSVAAGYVPLALGADGGGSIRIPAAMTGVFGIKPSYALCPDEGGFRAMSDFACAGPLSHSVADARLFLSVLAERQFDRHARKALKIAYCAAPERRPVHSGIRTAVERVAKVLENMGHIVVEADLDLGGWNDAFGPLVLAEEWRERGHLADYCQDDLTDYEAASLVAAQSLSADLVAAARNRHQEYRRRIDELFTRFDILLTPATASPAFLIGQRPREIDGQRVDRLWGAFPFTPAFNVAGTPAAAVPCEVVDGLPVSAQLVAARGNDDVLLDICEDLEEALNFRGKVEEARRGEGTVHG